MVKTSQSDKLPITLADEPLVPTSVFDPADRRGKENIGRDDVTLPRIAIAQKTSPQLEPDKTEYIAGLKLYELYNSLTKEKFGNGPLDFVVLRMDKRGMQFDAQNNIVDFDVPIIDPRLQFRTGPDGQRIKPEAVLFYDYIIVPVASRRPAVLSLKGTGVKVAKKLNAFIELAPGPSWAVTYRLTSSKGTQGSFSYGVYNIEPGGRTDASLLQVAEQMHTQLQYLRVNTDREAADPADVDAVPF